MKESEVKKEIKHYMDKMEHELEKSKLDITDLGNPCTPEFYLDSSAVLPILDDVVQDEIIPPNLLYTIKYECRRVFLVAMNENNIIQFKVEIPADTLKEAEKDTVLEESIAKLKEEKNLYTKIRNKVIIGSVGVALAVLIVFMILLKFAR